MTSSGPRNAWLRMADAMGLTEPGKSPQRPSLRLLLFSFVLWSLMTVLWWTKAVLEFSKNAPDYVSLSINLILAVITLGLAIAYGVMWRKGKKDSKGSNEI